MRLFVAVELPDAVKERVAGLQQELRPKVKSAKWVDPFNVHITLLFLGEVQESRVDSVITSLGQVRHQRFAAQLSGVGWFPGRARFARVIWVGLEQGQDHLAQLASQIDRCLAPLGFKRDKPFSPHITIARAQRTGKIPTKNLRNMEFSTEDFPVNHFSLVRSQLRPQGPIYTRLRSFLLD